MELSVRSLMQKPGTDIYVISFQEHDGGVFSFELSTNELWEALSDYEEDNAKQADD